MRIPHQVRNGGIGYSVRYMLLYPFVGNSRRFCQRTTGLSESVGNFCRFCQRTTELSESVGNFCLFCQRTII